MSSYVRPSSSSSVRPGLSLSRSAVGTFPTSRSEAPRYSSSCRFCRLSSPASGRRSAPPSPNLVKNPVMDSAAWSVPITSRLWSPPTAYCAVMRTRALVLPRVKSVSCSPVAAA